MKALRTVLCPVDFTTVTERTLEIAVQVCRQTGARLVLHHNLGPAPPDFLGVHWMWDEEHGDEDERREVSVSGEFGKIFATLPPDLEYEGKVSRGPLERGLLYLAETLPADLIVLGSHGSSSAEHQSITDQIVLRSPCSVLATAEEFDSPVFSAAQTASGERLPVLLATDLTGHDHHAVVFGFEFAESMPFEIHLLHVLGRKKNKSEPESVEAAAREQLAGLVPESLTDRVHLHLRWGSPAQEILGAAEELGTAFILLGSRKHGLLYRTFTGLTSLAVLHESRWPVWFVPASKPARRRISGVSDHATKRDQTKLRQPVRQGEFMDWKEAKQRTIAQWEGIRAGLGRELPADLVAEVNAVAELCVKAREAAGDPATRCNFCIAFGDVGGCSRVNLQITEAVLVEDWDRAKIYIDEVLKLLEGAKLPQEQAQRAS